MLVNEVPQSLGQPAKSHLVLAAPLVKLLDATVGEVHRLGGPPEDRVQDGGLLGSVRLS